MSGHEMPSVVVSRRDAIERRLPLLSARSGRPADGYLAVPVGLGAVERLVWIVTRRASARPAVQLPLTQKEFDQVLLLRRTERSGLVNAGVFVVLALALSRVPFLLSLGLLISAVSLALMAVARFGLRAAVPAVAVTKNVVTIDRVHRDFARVVARGDRRSV